MSVTIRVKRGFFIAHVFRIFLLVSLRSRPSSVETRPGPANGRSLLTLVGILLIIFLGSR